MPIIADSPKSAASQFALDERSLYKVKDSEDLKQKLEYWLLNVEERNKMELLYRDSSKDYKLDNSIDKFIDVIKLAIKNQKNDCLSLSNEAKTLEKNLKRIYF